MNAMRASPHSFITGKKVLGRSLYKRSVRPSSISLARYNGCSASRPLSTASAVDGSSTKESVSFDLPKIREEILQEWMMAEARSPNGSSIQARYCCFTYDDAKRAYQSSKASWHWLDRELSSNLAGETGAVNIYHGALAGLRLRGQFFPQDSAPTDDQQRNESVWDFCDEHMKTETEHLKYFQAIVPSHKHTRLVGIWKIAGWMVGFLPTVLGGRRALYVTVEAVETFVEEHFQEQIQKLQDPATPSFCPELLRLLKYCCEDEVHHKEDAVKKLLVDMGETSVTSERARTLREDLEKSWWVSPWRNLVHWGSRTAAEIARRI